MADLMSTSNSRDPLSLAEVALNPSVERAVAAVRDFLDMDVSFATRFDEDKQVFETVVGDAASFGLVQGAELPSDELYCRRVLAGELPRLLTDVRGNAAAALLPVTEAADIGAFVSVPITLSDGECYGTLCAASHATQPLLADRDVQFLHVLARLIADQLERDRLEGLTRSLQLQAAAARTLSAALAARDGYTGEHSEAVVELAIAVGERMGLDDDQLADVQRAALLHDLGKIAIPDHILHKPGPLDEQEWRIMRQHPVHGERLIADVAGLEHLAPVLRAEHERWDGRGYPDGLAGEAIPLSSRIAFVCDAYHAMTSDRPYRRSIGREAALAEIEAGAGSQFCPGCSRALIEVIAERPELGLVPESPPVVSPLLTATDIVRPS